MTASSSSLDTNLTVPDFSGGLQDAPPMSGPEMPGVGAQFQSEAVGNLPNDDFSGLFDFESFP